MTDAICLVKASMVASRGGGFWVPIVRQEVFQMGYTFGGKKRSKWVTHLEGESDPNGWHMDLQKEKNKAKKGKKNIASQTP